MALESDMSTDRQSELWQQYVAEIRDRPETPFAEQWARFQEIFADRDVSLPPPPAWQPDSERTAESLSLIHI